MHGANLTERDRVDWFRALRLCASLGACCAVSVLVSPLAAAPDPDLFDGHTSSSSSVSSGGEDSSSSDEASAAEDLQAGGAEPEESNGGNVAQGSTDSGAFGGGHDTVGEPGGEAKEGNAQGAGGGRDFSLIGGVGIGANTEVLEVNSSKASRRDSESTEVVSESEHRSQEEESAEARKGSGIGGGSSQPMQGVPQGDLGDSLPAGL